MSKLTMICKHHQNSCIGGLLVTDQEGSWHRTNTAVQQNPSGMACPPQERCWHPHAPGPPQHWFQEKPSTCDVPVGYEKCGITCFFRKPARPTLAPLGRNCTFFTHPESMSNFLNHMATDIIAGILLYSCLGVRFLHSPFSDFVQR